MKHLIETAGLSGLTRVDYDRVILDSTTDDVIIRSGYSNGHPYVDLGLPSGTLWATMNVGATSESDYGDYFQWGSTTPDTNGPCDWATAPFNNGSSSYDSVYFKTVKDTVCPNGVLAKKYDAAAQIMGGEWRMPTPSNCSELVNNTKAEWVDDYNGSGVKGRKFTGPNGNSIFFPASGYRADSTFRYQGDNCSVWISMLADIRYPDYACNFSIGSSINPFFITRRFIAYPVRGVL